MSADPLNPLNYTPAQLELREAVMVQHQTLVFRTTNQFLLPYGDQSQYEAYYYGLIGVPVALLATALVCLLVICLAPVCGRCCDCSRTRTKEVYRKVAFALFVLCGLGSIVCFGLLFATVPDMAASYSGLRTGMASTRDLALNASRQITSFTNQVTNWTASLDLVTQACSAELSLKPSLNTTLQQIGAGLLEASQSIAQAPVDTLNSLAATLSTAGSTSKDFEAAASIAFNVVIALFLTLSVIFLVLTCFSFLRKERRAEGVAVSAPRMCCRGACAVSPCCAATLAFSILFVILGVLFVLLFQVIGQASSDVCAPDVNANLQRIASQVTGGPILSTVPGEQCRPMQPLNLTGLSAAEKAAFAEGYIQQRVLCYYETCSGPDNNPVAVGLNQIQQAQAKLSQAAANASAELLNGTSCKSALLAETEYVGLAITVVATELIVLFSCSSINWLYQQIFYKTVCEGFTPLFLSQWKLLFAVCMFWITQLALFLFWHLWLSRDHAWAAEAGKDAREEALGEDGTQARFLAGTARGSSASGISLEQPTPGKAAPDAPLPKNGSLVML
jgi:hypothetical protein